MKNSLVLAPMYNVTDLPFRLLCREQGAGLCFTEMINAEAIARDNKAAMILAQSCERDRPLGLQLFGARVSSMEKAALKLASEAEFDFFDLNLGCPQQKVMRQGAGAALLKRPKRVQELVAALKKAEKPVSAKIRLNPNMLDSIKFCKGLEQAGVGCITVHARTIKQGFSGRADFVALKRIAKAVSVPVIANGNLRSQKDIETTLRETGAAAAMVGRAALGNPGVFAELEGKKGVEPIGAMFSYLDLCKEFGLNRFGRKKMQVMRFLAKAREKSALGRIQKAKTGEELESALLSIFRK